MRVGCFPLRRPAGRAAGSCGTGRRRESLPEEPDAIEQCVRRRHPAVSGCGAMRTNTRICSRGIRYAAAPRCSATRRWSVTCSSPESGSGKRRTLRPENAYHHPCHLFHALKSARAARVLAAIRNVRDGALEESDWCCGSAGSYNLTRRRFPCASRQQMGHVKDSEPRGLHGHPWL